MYADSRSINTATASREELIAALAGAEAAYSKLKQVRADTQQKLEETQQKLTSSEQLCEWYKRQVFGQKSERQIPQDPRQMTLFEVLEQPPAETTTVKEYERSARKKPTEVSSDIARFNDSVPVDEEVVFPEEVQGLSEDEYEIIGQKITECLMQIPTQYRLRRTAPNKFIEFIKQHL